MIRHAKTTDAAAISTIYKWYVHNTAITFETAAPDSSEMAERIAEYSKNYPYLVWEEGGTVVAYAYASRYKARKAFDPTTEISIYLHHDICGKGIGTKLLQKLIDVLKTDYPMYYTAAACISYPNGPSQHLFEKEGFVCSSKEMYVGYKLGEWRHTVTYFLPLRSYDNVEEELLP